MRLNEIILFEMPVADLVAVEAQIKNMMVGLGVTVVFAVHFDERSTDGSIDVDGVERGSLIKAGDLLSVFKRLCKRYQQALSDYDDTSDLLGIIRDHLNDLNIPFALRYIRRTKLTRLTLTTIMKKKNYISNSKTDVSLHV